MTKKDKIILLATWLESHCDWMYSVGGAEGMEGNSDRVFLAAAENIISLLEEADGRM